MWNQVRGGLTGAQPVGTGGSSGGLPEQPTALGNAAQFAGGLTDAIGKLGVPEEFVASLGSPAEYLEGVAKSIGTNPFTREDLNLVEKGVKPLSQALYNAVPDLPATKLAQASDLFNQVRAAVGSTPVPMTDAMKDTLDDIKEIKDLGTKGGSIAEKVVARLSNAENAPLSWNEARQVYSNIGGQTAGGATGNMQRLLLKYQSQLGDALESTAQQSGKLPEYQQAMKTWAAGSGQQEKLETIRKWAVGLGLGVLGEGALHKIWDLYGDLYGSKSAGH